MIDVRRWKRREHYLWFRKYEQPFFSVTVNVDVTAVWNMSRQGGAPSFFLTSMFHMLEAANETEAFRLRLRPRGVWRHDRIGVGPTVMRPDDTFGFVRLEPAASLEEFARRGQAVLDGAASRKALAAGKKERDDVVFHSVLPWLRFTSFTNAIPSRRDSIPRIVFGQCTREGRRMNMPVAVEVHHALVDGLDVASFFERFSGGLGRRVP
jgi:chloramphenicol O-acetyltransferase type A